MQGVGRMSLVMSEKSRFAMRFSNSVTGYSAEYVVVAAPCESATADPGQRWWKGIGDGWASWTS